MHIKWVLLIITIFFLMTFSCVAGGRNAPSIPLETTRNKSILEFIDDGYDFEISEISKAIIVAQLGEPEKCFKKNISNPYYNDVDTKYTLSYPGLTLTFVELSGQAGGGLLFHSIIITSKKWPLKKISIGMTVDEVINIFPLNYRWRNSTTLEYSDHHTPNVVLLHFSKNRLVKVEWELYSG